MDEDEVAFRRRRGEGDGGGALDAGAGEGEDFAEAVFGMPDEHAVVEGIGRDGGETCGRSVCGVGRPTHNGGTGRASGTRNGRSAAVLRRRRPAVELNSGSGDPRTQGRIV